MWTAPFEKKALEERPAPSEQASLEQWKDLEPGLARAVFRDSRGVEHLRIYLPPPEGTDELWEIVGPEDESAPLELLSPERLEP